ncbi:MAG: SRPBCC family protein [Myxococcota bacterium]
MRSFTSSQRALLEPHLERGPVLLARFYDAESDMPAITLASYIEAPAAEVAATVNDPRGYARFMPAVDSVRVESERGNQIAYAWTWQLALFTLRGSNVMSTYGGGSRGYRIDVRGTDGDLGESRFVWRIHPAGENRSLVIISSRTDMRGANYVADQLARGGRSVQRSINVSMAMVMMLGTKCETERSVGHVPQAGSLDALERPNLNVRRLWPLLAEGDLVFMELEGDSISRIAGMARSSRGIDHTRAVMIDPEEFGRSLISGSTAEILERTEDSVLFEWGIPLPLVGVEGRMRLFPGPGGAAGPTGEIVVQGVSGSLASSDWHFDTTPINDFETVITGWSRYDMHETSAVVRRMIGNDVAFAHGLAVATQVMILRSLRTRARRHHFPATSALP